VKPIWVFNNVDCPGELTESEPLIETIYFKFKLMIDFKKKGRINENLPILDEKRSCLLTPETYLSAALYFY